MLELLKLHEDAKFLILYTEINNNNDNDKKNSFLVNELFIMV